MRAIVQAIDCRLSQLSPPSAARSEQSILGQANLEESEPPISVADAENLHPRLSAALALGRITAHDRIAGIDVSATGLLGGQFANGLSRGLKFFQKWT